MEAVVFPSLGRMIFNRILVEKQVKKKNLIANGWPMVTFQYDQQ